VAARFISRIYIVHRVTMSDYAMLVGWVLLSGLSAANIYATTKGLGLREGVLESWRDPLARAEYVFGVLYVRCKSSQEGLSSLSNNTNIVSRSGGHQVIDPPILPDAGKRRVHLPSWNLHHSLCRPTVGVCVDIGQPFPLSSSLCFLSDYNSSWNILYRHCRPLCFHGYH
jgi:hypothetical protein